MVRHLPLVLEVPGLIPARGEENFGVRTRFLICKDDTCGLYSQEGLAVMQYIEKEKRKKDSCVIATVGLSQVTWDIR